MFEEPYRWTEAVGNRRAYVDAQLTHGSPVVAVSCQEGILLVTVQRGIPKLYEIYDRIALGGMGHPADLETLRASALDMAHVEGFNRSPSDVTAMRLIKYGLAPVVKRAYEELFRAPLIAKVLLAQMGLHRGQDVLVTLDYDGTFEQSSGRAVLAARTSVADAMRKQLDRSGSLETASIEVALQAALRAWAVGDLAQREDHEANQPADDAIDAHLKAVSERVLDMALLDRESAGVSKYRLFTPREVADALAPWSGPDAAAR